MTTGTANLTNLQTKFLKMAKIDQQSDNTAPVAQPTDNVAAAPEITDARIESDTLIPPDARTDAANAVLPQDIEIIGDDGNVLANDAADSAPPIVKAALSDRDINAAPEGERSAPEAKPVDRDGTAIQLPGAQFQRNPLAQIQTRYHARASASSGFRPHHPRIESS